MAIKPMYTMDYVRGNMPFSFVSDFMMRVASLHGIDESAPLWDIEFSLENRSGKSMEGFVAMEYTLFDPETHSFFGDMIGPIAPPRYHSFNLCAHRHDFEDDDESRVQFQDWSFGGVDGLTANNTVNHRPVYANFNFTHPVHETGIWMNVIHLCVTKGPRIYFPHRHHHHRRWPQTELRMHGHQTGVNPLGLLSGDRLMALPTLFAVGSMYIAVFIIWCILMLKHRANLIPSIHWMLLFGIVLMMTRVVWIYTAIWRLNERGFERPSLKMMIFNQCISHSISLYVRTAAMIISTGTGIARPDLGKTMTRFLIVYAIIFGVVDGRVEWIDFLSFHSRWYDRSSGSELEMYCLENLQFGLNMVFVAMTFFNAMATAIKMESDQQFHKEKVFRKLIIIALLSMIASIGLRMMDIWTEDNVETLDPANWAFVYMVDDGFRDFLNLIFAVSILSVLRPHENSARMAYSVEIPTTGSDDIPTDGAAGATASTEEREDSSWNEMFAAVGQTGPWMVRKVWAENQEEEQ